MKKRKFYKEALNHCYQRTVRGGVLFYAYSDHLVYFSLYCLAARRHSIRVLSLCQMPDHIHDSVFAGRLEDLEGFKRDTNSGFARAMRNAFHTKGPVFERPFGSAPKTQTKYIRTNLVYVGNNPVEWQLAGVAEAYRWNYLAYAGSDHPFSKKLVVRKARKPLQKAVQEVKALHRAGKPLNYTLVGRLFAPLDPDERQQLTDFIITTYNVIDYQGSINYFGSYEKMLDAMHATAGSEHDLNEVFTGRSDAFYARMSGILIREKGFRDIHELLMLDPDEKLPLFRLLLHKTGAPPEQIAKFLHLPLNHAPAQNSPTEPFPGSDY